LEIQILDLNGLTSARINNPLFILKSDNPHQNTAKFTAVANPDFGYFPLNLEKTQLGNSQR